jgi:cytochrome c peroxidase
MRFWGACAISLLAACGDAQTIAQPAAPATPTSAPRSLRSKELLPPLPSLDDENLDRDKVELGQALFFSTLLSAKNNRCHDCHILSAHGVDRSEHKTADGLISTPTVLNAGYNWRHTWAGKDERLGDVIRRPIKKLMGWPADMGDDLKPLIDKLQKEAPTLLVDLAKLCRGTPKNGACSEGVFGENYVGALEAAIGEYLVAITPRNSPFDRYQLGDKSALSADAVRGKQKFEQLGCISCHQGRNVGGNMYAKLGAVREYTAWKDGWANGNAEHVFRVPSLRNVGDTKPYFHDGSQPELEDAIKTMIKQQLGRKPEDDDVKEIAAFLRSLSGTPQEPALLDDPGPRWTAPPEKVTRK